jgi:hypothetical protein
MSADELHSVAFSLPDGRCPLRVMLVCTTVACLLSAPGCDAKGGGANAGASTRASAIVGASGGVVSLPGGPWLSIPSGAVPSPTEITVERTDRTAPCGSTVFRFGPEGTIFAQPVTVILPLPEGMAAAAVYWSKPGSAAAFDVLPAIATAGGVQAQGTHFSSIFVGPSTGSAVCANAGADTDGAACGSGLACVDGACGARISGRIAGAVAAGVTVSLGGGAAAVATTDASGSFAFDGLAAGEYTVSPSLAGYVFEPASAAVTLAGANVSGQDFAAAGAYAISGKVSGAVAAGVTVSLAGAAPAITATDSSGRYSFTGLTAGSYVVSPSLAGYTFDPASAPVSVATASVAHQDFTGWRPVLASLQPSEGHVGASVALTGDLFGPSSSGGSVTLGDLPMVIVSWSNTQIVATVPSGATPGEVRVHAGGAISEARPFTVTATVSGQLVDGAEDDLAGSWAFAGDGGPAQLVVSAAGTGRSALSASAPGSGWGGMPRAFSLEVPLGTHTLEVQELDGQGHPTVDLLQSASRRTTGVAVGEDGIADLRIPLRWHWEVHALDPGYSVCGFERQIWFHDALHGFATFQVNPGVDPSLTSPDSERIHGMLMSTSDGGKTWSVARADISTSFADFRPTASGWFANGFLLSLSDGLLLSLGDNGALVRSTDSGQSWAGASLNWATLGPGGVGTTRFAPAGSKLYASITTGGVQGSYERSQLVVSEDEGLTWSQRFDVCNPNYYAPNGCGTPEVPLGFAGIDMACSDVHPEHCITMGYEHDNYTSKVMVTRDGFQTYTTLEPKCGWFTDGQVLWRPGTDAAWVVGSSSCPGTGTQSIATTDGGLTWSDWAPSPLPGRAAFADATHAVSWWDWGVRMSRDGAATWVYTGHAPAAGAGMRTLHVLDAEHAWALGHPDCRSSGAALVARWVP